MELTALMDDRLGSESGTPLYNAGPISSRLRNFTGSEELTNPLVAACFWQAFIGRDEEPYFGAPPLRALRDGSRPIRQALVVQHGGHIPCFDLIVYDPRYDSERIITANLPEDELRRGWATFSRAAQLNRHVARNSALGEIAREGMVVAIEASRAHRFRVLITPEIPVLRPTAGVPSPFVDVEGVEKASIGVVATDGSGDVVGTTAMHAVAGASNILVRGNAERVIATNALLDSAIISLSGSTGPTTNVKPLTGMLPRLYDDVSFEGLGSKKVVKTKVTGWTPELPHPIPNCQSRIATRPCLNWGDSGCALLDSSGHVLGFAIGTAAHKASAQLSAWVWAESVYSAHKLS